MEFLTAMRTILPLALASGINLYLTILVVGLSIRFDWVADVPPGLAVLAATPILIIAGIFYVIEFVADKVPLIDTIWDVLHTVIRPAGAVLIASSSLEGIDPNLVGATARIVGVNPRVDLLGATIACGVALLSHSGKAGTRTAVNASGGSVTLAGVGLSLLEDLFVACIAFLALRYPTAANIIAIVLIVLLIIIVPQLLRWSWFTLRALIAWIRGRFRPIRQSEPIPEVALEALRGRPALLSMRCTAQGRRPLRGRQGTLVITEDRLLFAYKRWFRQRVWSLPRHQIRQAELRKRLLARMLDLNYDGGQPEAIHFAVSADRFPLLDQALALLQARPAGQRPVQPAAHPGM